MENQEAKNEALIGGSGLNAGLDEIAWLIERKIPLAFWNGAEFDLSKKETWTLDSTQAIKFQSWTSAGSILMTLARFNARLKYPKEPYRISFHEACKEAIANYKTAEHMWVNTMSPNIECAVLRGDNSNCSPP